MEREPLIAKEFEWESDYSASRRERSSCAAMAEVPGGGGGGGGEGALRVYRRRWLMLTLFAATSCVNAAHWLQFAIIANVVERFYGVDALAVNWTSMIYMAVYVPLVLPASWLMDRYGLRVAVVSGAAIMMVGAWLKVGSAHPSLFPLAFAGQTLVGAAQMFTLGAPARLAALWFGPGQVATACAIGVFGNQVGIALGFLLPPELVSAHVDEEQTASDLRALYIGFAAAPTAIFLLLLFLFEAAPPSPPSLAAQRQREQRQRLLEPSAQPPPPADRKSGKPCKLPASGSVEGAGSGTAGAFCASLVRVARNRSFVLLWLAYGLNVGVFYAVSTLLNQMVLLHFKDAEEDAGRIGLTMVLAGVVGSIVGGIVLDRTRRFKETTLVVYVLALAGMLGFTFALASGYLALVYVSGAFLGFFTTGYLGIGYEYAAELTYPVPESTSSGLLNAASEIFGVILTLGSGEMLDRVGDRVTNLTLTGILALGLILSAFVRGKDLTRSQAAVQPVPADNPDKFLA